MKRFKSIVVAGFAAVIATASVLALPTNQASAVSSAALSITPKKNYTIEPGKSVKDKLIVRNLDAQIPLHLSLRVVDFTFNDDSGTPKLMLAQDAPQTTWSLKPFMNVPNTVTIPPNSTKSLDMNIAIPAGHGAGSYYSAIVYSAGAGDGDTGNVGLNASGVSLVFVQIPGKVNEDLKPEKFGAYTYGKDGGKPGYMFIATDMPKMMAYTLKNNGNVTEAPVGTIKLKSMFGKEYTINDVNPNKSLALIGQTRTYTSCIKLKAKDVDFKGKKAQATVCEDPGLWPGMYTATLDIFYGQNGNNTQEIVKTAVFWYLPWWFILIVTVVLLIVAFYVWKIVRAVRRMRDGGIKMRKPTRRK